MHGAAILDFEVRVGDDFRERSSWNFQQRRANGINLGTKTTWLGKDHLYIPGAIVTDRSSKNIQWWVRLANVERPSICSAYLCDRQVTFM